MDHKIVTFMGTEINFLFVDSKSSKWVYKQLFDQLTGLLKVREQKSYLLPGTNQNVAGTIGKERGKNEKQGNRGDMRKIHVTQQFFEASGQGGDFFE